MHQVENIENVLAHSNGRKPRQSLGRMPLNIFVNILAFMKPLNIIAMRKTCKSLRVVTYRRIVWLNACILMVLTNAIYDGTFPLNDMTNLLNWSMLLLRWNDS
ncbi:hypothetical protein BT96DRAFT_915074 [Gymnopus androsaceus JB14]|uniref:F-box domain-containing protein n=1 Tax=Gymnopus androsaceus JB14 TaxID=1447944 RepID=A0A6A4I8J2_9AGAR|nr:hypothetical protein BT96DRAFT_915074 [Gymnopus androsaceus JB14]